MAEDTQGQTPGGAQEKKAPEPIQFEHVINGKRVLFRARLPLSLGHNIVKLLNQCNSADLNDHIAAMTVLIESWEFPGDPTKAATYQEMDILSELIPLEVALGVYVGARFEAAGAKKR